MFTKEELMKLDKEKLVNLVYNNNWNFYDFRKKGDVYNGWKIK
jgi:hypothetical protein